MGGILDYAALLAEAKEQSKRAHQLLREYGTEGLQTPIKRENGELVGTVRFKVGKGRLQRLGESPY